MTSTLGRTRRGLLLCILTTWTCVLTTSAPAADTVSYQYQIHRTQQGLNSPHEQHVAVRLGDGRIGIFGGSSVPSVEVFDPNTEIFTATKASRLFGNLSGIALMDGDALLVDGTNDCTFDYRAEQYVGTANAYSAGLVRWAVPVLLPDGKVFLCGGCNADFNVSDTCVIYDPRARQFTSCGQLQVARSSHTATLIAEDLVLIIGGYNRYAPGGDTPALDSLEVLNLRTGTSALVRTTLREARYNHASVQLADGRILILGGVSWPLDLSVLSTEIFDPRTSTMVNGPDMTVGRDSPETAVMPSGRVAVFGGRENEQRIDLYDPNSNTFVLAECTLLSARWTGFTATRLDSGAVLLAGGRSNATDPALQTAEIFEEIAVTTKSDTSTTK